MNINVKTIASFNENGKIRPCWVQIRKSGKDIVYKVKGCSAGKSVPGLGIFYLVILDVDGREEEVKMMYDILDHKWSLVINKSSLES